MIIIPPNKKWAKNPSSDSTVSLLRESNLDLTSNEGKTRISPRMVITTDDTANMGVPVGFVRFNSTSTGYWTVAGSYVFKTATADPSLAFAQDAQSDTPTTCSSDTSDIIFFRKANKLVVSTDTDIYYNAGSGSWNDITGTPLTGGSPHMFTEYGNRLYVTDEFKKILSLDTSMSLSTSGPNTLSLGTYSSTNVGPFITTHLADSTKIWIFTATQQYGEFARVFTWDGATADTPLNSQGYVLDCGGIIVAVMKDDTPYAITVEGELVYFNGGTFARVHNGKLPVNRDKFLKNAFSTVNNRPIHPRGMIVTPQGKINILLNNLYEDDTYEEKLPSGIWEFDLTNTSLGWYHKNSLSLYTSSVTDYGQNLVSRVGALAYIKTPGKAGNYIAGAQIYSDASNTKEVIEIDDSADTIQKYGQLVTDKIYSGQIADTFGNMYVRFKRFLDSGDKITAKYRVDDPEPTNISITWTSTTTFTTSTNILGKEGYEVEILQGTGGNMCSHITNIAVSNSGGTFTYTATVDETHIGATGTAKARLQNWIKIGSFSNQYEDWTKFLLSKTGTWVQLKLCALFSGKDEINDIILTNNTKVSAI